MRILLVGGPLDGQWHEVGREPETLEAGGGVYQRVLWMWPPRDALWLFWWHGKPEPEAVLATLDKAALAPVCSRREALGYGALEVSAARPATSWAVSASAGTPGENRKPCP
ncbi:hypothetical protein [Crenobacter intestini]|uniref:Uncharacterized protein n=1 Tax=Crenobacter intestini TaxID=2563443 RepID=A0A4V4N968_9NEIS|nr:hypothetical protein [Crenobacter intestini]TIC87253.1 hypothetical protein E5K04_02200 [Crenobacter intestini]